MKTLTNKIRLEFSDEKKSILIFNNEPGMDWPLPITISTETLKKMSLSDAAEFVGERVLLLIPEMRELYKEYLYSGDGFETLPKKT